MDRLNTICSLVAKNAVVHDIGCDHGYLLLKLYPNISCGFALDVAQKPLNTAINTINQNNLGDKITAILSDGLEKVDPEIADTIVIAGMGAELIIDILSKHSFIFDSKYTFLLQPMTKTELLRQFLYEKGFEIVEEKISKEQRRFYTILKCKYTEKVVKKDILDCYVSEKLIKECDFLQFANYTIDKNLEICSQIDDTTNDKFIYYTTIIEKMRGYIDENTRNT